MEIGRRRLSPRDLVQHCSINIWWAGCLMVVRRKSLERVMCTSDVRFASINLRNAEFVSSNVCCDLVVPNVFNSSQSD